MIMNVFALTPLLERFESEYGTLTSLALFFGRETHLTTHPFSMLSRKKADKPDENTAFSTLPAFLYILIEKAILHSNNGVMGASVWFFLLLGAEAMRTYRTNPHFTIATYNIPTWATPLILVLIIAALVPSTSLLGHVAGLAVGYVCGLGYLKFLSPPEKALRWVEARLKLLQRLPRYVSVDQKTYGRFGVLPTAGAGGGASQGVPLGVVGTGGAGQRLGP